MDRPGRPVPIRAWLGLALAMAAAFATWAVVLGTPDFPLDDSYITLHNARVVLEGHDASYGVSPLIGATSPVHLALVAGFGLVLPLSWASAAAGWLAAFAYGAGLLFLAQRCALSRSEAALLAVLGYLAGLSALHLVNGLETGLAMALVLWSLALAMGAPGRILPALLGTMPFVRPELAILAGLLFCDQTYRRWRSGDGRAIAADAAILALAALPWLAWTYIETGALVPHTADAKRVFFAQEALPWMGKLRVVAHALGRVCFQVGPLALAVIGLRGERAGRLAFFFAAIMLALFGMQFPGGLNHNWQRYLYTLVPLLLVGLAFALKHAAPTERRWLRGLTIASLLYGAALFPFGVHAYAKRIAFAREGLAGVADWVTHNLPPDARIAVHDAGYIAFTDRTLIDIVGLKTPASSAIHARITAPSGGRRRGEALAAILAESRADYLIVLEDWDRDFRLVDSIRAAGGVLEPLRSEGAYRVYRTGRHGG